jgi:hypothetical protein
MFTINDSLYCGSTNNFGIFDYKSNSFNKKASINSSVFSVLYSFSVGNNGYVIASVNGIKTLFIYTPTTNTWVSRNYSIPMGENAALFIIQNKVYFISSWIATNCARFGNDVWEFNTTYEFFTRKNNFPLNNFTPSFSACAPYIHGTTINDTGYVLIDYNTFYKYNQNSDNWTLSSSINDWYPGQAGTCPSGAICYSITMWSFDNIIYVNHSPLSISTGIGNENPTLYKYESQLNKWTKLSPPIFGSMPFSKNIYSTNQWYVFASNGSRWSKNNFYLKTGNIGYPNDRCIKYGDPMNISLNYSFINKINNTKIMVEISDSLGRFLNYVNLDSVSITTNNSISNASFNLLLEKKYYDTTKNYYIRVKSTDFIYDDNNPQQIKKYVHLKIDPSKFYNAQGVLIPNYQYDTICSGNRKTISANARPDWWGSTNQTISYQWYKNGVPYSAAGCPGRPPSISQSIWDGSICGGGDKPYISLYQTGTYYVNASSSDACYSQSNNIYYTVFESPQSPYGDTYINGVNQITCNNDSVLILSYGNTQIEYLWYNGNTLIKRSQDPFLKVGLPATYTATAKFINTGTFICSRSSSIQVTSTKPLGPTISANGSLTISPNGSVTLISNSNSGNQWYRNGTIIPGANSSSYVANIAGSYYVINTSNNCMSLPSNTLNVVLSQSLPIQFSVFKAYNNNNQNIIIWQTFNDYYIEYYDVQKSINGSNWNSIERVNSKKYQLMNSYLSNDTKLNLGNNYYRIKSVENDGNIQYSQIVNVKIGKAKNSFNVFPNPIQNNTIQLQLEGVDKGIYNVVLYNQAGQQIFKNTINHAGGSASESLNTGKISKGIYQLIIEGLNVKTSTKTIVVE